MPDFDGKPSTEPKDQPGYEGARVFRVIRTADPTQPRDRRAAGILLALAIVLMIAAGLLGDAGWIITGKWLGVAAMILTVAAWICSGIADDD